MTPLPLNQNERRQDCIDHENRIDEIASELHKHGGWWKVIGGGLIAACTILGWFGTAIDSKLVSIQGMLSETKVVVMQHSEQIKSLQGDVKELQEKNKFEDQERLRR